MISTHMLCLWTRRGPVEQSTIVSTVVVSMGRRDTDIFPRRSQDLICFAITSDREVYTSIPTRVTAVVQLYNI